MTPGFTGAWGRSDRRQRGSTPGLPPLLGPVGQIEDVPGHRDEMPKRLGAGLVGPASPNAGGAGIEPGPDRPEDDVPAEPDCEAIARPDVFLAIETGDPKSAKVPGEHGRLERRQVV